MMCYLGEKWYHLLCLRNLEYCLNVLYQCVCVRVCIREGTVCVCGPVYGCTSVNNVHIKADIGGLLGYMCISSLVDSCVSCFVQVHLLYLCCTSLCVLGFKPLLTCYSVCACVCVCTNLHVCKKKTSVLLCSTLCSYCKFFWQKMMAIFRFLLRKNVNVSLLFKFCSSIMEVIKCMWRIKLCILLWRACQS